MKVLDLCKNRTGIESRLPAQEAKLPGPCCVMSTCHGSSAPESLTVPGTEQTLSSRWLISTLGAWSKTEHRKHSLCLSHFLTAEPVYIGMSHLIQPRPSSFSLEVLQNGSHTMLKRILYTTQVGTLGKV